MLENGNGAAARCVRNLLLIRRGEVPYARMKGLDADLIDRPSVNTAPIVEADAEWLVEDYEPRVSLDSIEITAELAEDGQFAVNVNTILNE